MPTVTVNGHELHHVRRGSGEPLLLIMGMSGTHLSWGDPFLDAVARDFEAITYDHRGVGHSSRIDADFTIADLADDAAGLVDALELDTAHVLGVSMGGMVAQELALRHPERVRTLTIGCSWAGGASATPPEAALQRLGEGWGSGDRERILRTAWEVNVGSSFADRPGEYERWHEMATSLPVPLPVILRQLQAGSAHDTVERLGGITAPTLVVHGTEDEMLPVENGRVIAARIPGSRLVELDGVGHMFWWEEPQRSAELVREHARSAAPAG